MVECDAWRGEAPARVHLAARAQDVPAGVRLADVENVGLVTDLFNK